MKLFLRLGLRLATACLLVWLAAFKFEKTEGAHYSKEKINEARVKSYPFDRSQLTFKTSGKCIPDMSSTFPIQKSVELKIVNGTVVPLGTVPYQVSLLSGGVHHCGGSIISANYVLTAAHCVTHYSNYAVRAGLNNIDKPEAGHQTIRVSKIIPHKNYIFGNHQINDIALLKLERPLILSNSLRTSAIKLPSQGYNASGTVTVTGWGRIRYHGPISDELRAVSLDVATDFNCQSSFSTFGNVIADSMLCAGVPDGGKSACNGDSGGPLVEDSSGLLVGIVSFGILCSTPKYPLNVFTEVSYFADWISENSK